MNERTMRAKLQVGMVQENFGYQNDKGDWVHQSAEGAKPVKNGETLAMHAVAKNGYDSTGLDEDNDYAKWSPGAALSINIANPNLWGKFKHGDKFYVDFTPAP